MNCSVQSCPNNISKPINSISFHRFPKNIEILKKWIIFIGNPKFIPTSHSKICSIHFKESDYSTRPKLKGNAVPSLLPLPLVQQSTQSSSADPTACILGSNSTIMNVELVQEINSRWHGVTGISTSKHVAKTSAIQNLNQEVVLPTTHSSEVSSQFSQNTDNQSESVNKPHRDIYKCPIKVVDMKKLLEKPPEEDINVKEQLGQVIGDKQNECNLKFKVNTTVLGRKAETSVQNIPKGKKCSNNRDVPFNISEITVLHILECLRDILPDNYDLARLVPNEKIASLIIRYYNLNDDEIGLNSVLTTLKLVMKGIRLKEKVFEDNASIHPYLMISDNAIKTVLSYILPKNFSLADVSKEVLKCMCQWLNQEIFSDGYQILLKRMRKYSAEALAFKTVSKNKQKVVNQPSKNKTRKIVHRGSRKPFGNNIAQNVRSEIGASVERVTSHYSPVKTEIELHGNNTNSYIANDSKININEDQCDMDCTSESEPDLDDDYIEDLEYKTSSEDNEWLPPIKQKKTPKSKKIQCQGISLKNILKYLELEKCLAKDVLCNFKLMFHLCRYLQVRTRRGNVKQIEKLLKIITERKVQTSSEVEDDPKLKVKTIVTMHDLADYSKEQMTFMRIEEKYTDAQVKKLTEECFKHFRKIIIKRKNSTVVFRLKYTKLSAGTVVFVKDFRRLSQGWLRGTVDKQLGTLKYSVKLDSGEIRLYVPEQMRPIINQKDNELVVNVGTNLTSRRNRPIKLKQLLDL